MTTRIDGNQGSPLPAAIDRTRANEATGGRKEPRGTSAATDRVEISPDLALVNAAMQAPGDAPAIRADKVEAARQALIEGKVGTDAEKLADVLIDHMLDRRG